MNSGKTAASSTPINPFGERSLLANGWQPEVFKTTGETKLQVWHLPPSSKEKKQQSAAIVLFYGGGWRHRNIAHFQKQGEHFASLGMHVTLADYRSEIAYGGTPFDCVADAKSAISYLRSNADRLQIDPQRIAAGGGSAGGQLAAACALVPGFCPPDEVAFSSKPNALVLFNPVYDNSPAGYGHERILDRWQEISPMYHITQEAPPNIVFLGTNDCYIPVQTAQQWQKQMQAVKVRSDLHLFEGGAHGFFNEGKAYQETLNLSVAFLESLNYI